MQVASKVIFLYRDADGFGPAISEALQAKDGSIRRKEVSFELSLERYGINDRKVLVDAVHFIDHEGFYQVSILLLQEYALPLVSCAIHEVLSSITGENSSIVPTIIVPFLVAAKLKCETENPTTNGQKTTLCGTQIGPATDFTRAMVAKTCKPTSSLQIHNETLACLLQFVRILKLPTVLLIGSRGQHKSQITSDEDMEVLYEMGEFLGKIANLHFVKDQIHLAPSQKSGDVEEPWRALYG
ncbi:uncharacterized protein LOC122066158 [Macadamia integrifolia]|uniref:uncharacterized protein LOC122066158 n=1 Tax=Macadamia integrifolia TaxID=60698 RepID=UPI001C4EB7F5|nr:uncharacterized protein LOC122066158 [Macadamia integrifolia]